jgi:ADP-heptose:LPS heptosyltransferase
MNVNDQEILNPRKLRSARILSKMCGTFKPRRKSNLPFDKMSIRRILVQEHQCIGDVLMLEPTLRALKKGYPNATIDLLCVEAVARLAQKAKLADHILVYPRQIPYKISYDLVIDFHGDIRRLKLLKKYNSKYRAGFNFSGGARYLTHVVDYPYKNHQVERPFDLLTLLGINIESIIPRLEGLGSKFKIAKRILLHPGANNYYRMWPPEEWRGLIGMLEADGYEVIWINPPGGHCNLDVKQFSGDLLELAELMQTAALLVGVDSMSGHLAGALGIPTLTIFGSQNPELTRPYHKDGHIIKPQRRCLHVKKNWRLCSECMANVRSERVRLKIKKIINTQ